jgi:hypothetical protein
MFLQRYDGVGFPWRKTIGSPSPTSTYAMLVSRTLTRFRNASASVEIAHSASGCIAVSDLMTVLVQNLGVVAFSSRGDVRFSNGSAGR